MEGVVKIPPIVAQDVERVVQRVGNSLTRLLGKRLFITGGTGFLGTWLIETLAWFNTQCDRSCQIDVLTRHPEKFAKKVPHLAERSDIHLLAGDVQRFDYPDRAYDFIIHAAAPADPGALQRESVEVADTIVAGTRHVLALAAQKIPEGFLYVSSGAVYGLQPPDLWHVPEDYSGGPTLNSSRAVYGEAKRYAETLCALYQERFDISLRIARPFALVGPYQDLESGFAVTDFIRNGMRELPLRIHGDGTTIRSYYYAADCAAALFKILLEAPIGRVYNVGSDEPVTILALAKKIAAIFGGQSNIIVEQPFQPGRLPARYVPDIRLGKTEIELDVWTSLDEALQRTVDWYHAL
jgi:nucleoside-diphosphate-sugar epimerase